MLVWLEIGMDNSGFWYLLRNCEAFAKDAAEQGEEILDYSFGLSLRLFEKL